jgi:hypothetical protein
MGTAASHTTKLGLRIAIPVAILFAFIIAPSGEGARSQVLSGSITLTNQTWTCSSAVDLDSVTVTIGAGQPYDAIHLEQGCTGRIGRIQVVTSAIDGVKVNNATNLSIQGGSIICIGHNAGAHQDGIQAMAGKAVTLTNLTVGCTTANNSEFFVSQADPSLPPPTDIVCNQCYLYGTTSSTVFVTAHTVGSGVENSTICPSPLTYRKIASDAIDKGNTYPSSCPSSPVVPGPPPVPVPPPSSPPPPGAGTPAPSKPSSPGKPSSSGGGKPPLSVASGAPDNASAAVSVTQSSTTVTYGSTLRLSGTGPGGSGQPVAIEGWSPGQGSPAQVATTTTDTDGSWHTVVVPRMFTVYQARVGELRSPRIQVFVRPRVTLTYKRPYFVVRVSAVRCCAGRFVFLQRRQGKRWVNVKRFALGRASGRIFEARLPRGASHVRAVIPASQAGHGYSRGTSRVLRVRS